MGSKWTAADVPDQSGRTAVVTGSNTGLGYDTAAVLAARGAHVVLAVRNPDKGAEAAERIRAAHPGAAVTVQQLDLSSLASVRKAAEEIRANQPRIDLLINNAGLMYVPRRELTEDGFEMHFGTNHLGHFALTGLLVDHLGEGSRIVSVASIAHRILARIRFEDPHFESGYNRVAAYGQSKLANLLFTYELQRRLAAAGRPTIAVAAHPGISNTELMRYIPVPVPDILYRIATQPAEQGALPTLRAATDPAVQDGQYYGPDGLGELRGHPKLVASSAQSHNQDIARRLWTMSEELTGVSFPI